MFLPIPKVLKEAELRQVREALAQAKFDDGAPSAGRQARRVKRNEQLPRDSEAAKKMGGIVSGALRRHAAFISAALPYRMTEPLFNRYAPGMRYGAHIDNAIMFQTPPLRSDVSVTVFLSEPSEYDGGELVMEEIGARRKLKLAAGAALLYPSTSLHRVEPVTRGARLAAVLWVQSLVRDAEQRRLLFELDRATQAVARRTADAPELALLGKTYHNLLRMWAGA